VFGVLRGLIFLFVNSHEKKNEPRNTRKETGQRSLLLLTKPEHHTDRDAESIVGFAEEGGAEVVELKGAYGDAIIYLYVETAAECGGETGVGV
jgi:hypothetical protein